MSIYYRVLTLLFIILQGSLCQENGTSTDMLYELRRPDGSARIKGAEPAPEHMFSYVALIQVYNTKGAFWFTDCHGIITDPYTILTVNSCINVFMPQGGTPRAVAGAHNIQTLEKTKQVRSICRTEAFAPTNNQNEFKNMYAVIHLNEPFVFNSFVTSVNLPVPGMDISQIQKPCWFVTWATCNPDKKKKYDIPQQKPVVWTDCEAAVQHDSTICSGDDVCCDQGAPIVCLTKENYFFTMALAIKNSHTTDCNGQGLYANLLKMDYGWYNRSLDGAKAACRPSELLIT